MIDSPSLPMMTKYFLKKIIRKNKDDIDINESDKSINNIDIEALVANLHRDSNQQAICIKQLESLATMYQIYSKQNQLDELHSLEQKILYLLGYTIQR